jgi:hypothetical protein
LFGHISVRVICSDMVVEAVESAPLLTHEGQRGLADALASLRAGDGRTPDQVRHTIESLLRR